MRGAPLVEIRVAATDAGWRWATGFSFYSGSHWGSSSPLSDHSPACPTRDDAVSEAAAHLKRKLVTATDPAMQRERTAMLAWLDGLTPAQGALL